MDAVVASAATDASEPAAFVAEVAAAAAEALASFALVVAVWALVATCEAYASVLASPEPPVPRNKGIYYSY